MNRRPFFGTLVGGVATAAAVRTWPFRVYSFPSLIVPGDRIMMHYGPGLEPGTRVVHGRRLVFVIPDPIAAPLENFQLSRPWPQSLSRA